MKSQSLLIVKCGALGDVVRTTSLLEPLRKAFAGPVTWVTSARARPLLEGHPGIELVAAGSAQARGLGRDFDVVLSLEEDLESAALAERCCRKTLIGVYPQDGGLAYTDSSAAYYDMSLLRRKAGGLEAANRLKGANRLSYARLWLKALGLPAPRGRDALRPSLALTDSDRREARALARRHGLKSRRAIGINPGAGARWPSKQLSEQACVALIRALGPLDRPILLLGGKEEAERNRRIARALPAGTVIRPDTVDLRAFAGLLELCAAVVVTDSLALHLATALGLWTVALIGPTSAAELDVYGRGRKLQAPGGCGCFYAPRCRQAVHCLDRIPAARVVAAVRKGLS